MSDTKQAKAEQPKDRVAEALYEIPETSLTSTEIEDKLIKARIEMLISAPFFGNLATRLRFKDATEWCPTLATDGRYFYYNRNFVAAMSDAEIVFGIGHEVLHCVYDHFDVIRRGDRDPRLWNIANDYVINADLIDAKIGEEIKLVKICFDWKYRGMVSEEVYDDLFEQAKEEGRVMDMESFDMHLDRDDGDDDGAQGEGGEANSEGGDKDGPARYTAEEKDQISQEFKNATMQAAKAAGAGNLPGGVKRALDHLLNPQLDWRQLIAMQIQSVIKSDYTYQTPSRKGLNEGFYLPGMDRETTIDVAISMDVSGSIYDTMLRDFLSEVKGIMDQYTDFRIHLFCFDTEVHNPVTFTPHNMEEFLEYDIQGGGGTEFDCVFDYMKEAGIVPKKHIMFTDGYPWGSWGDENYCDTLFIVHGSGYGGKSPVAPWGITVPYTREDD
ncbi:VWA-like domain-containing protein [bacterium]|jgi:predicted metal-dependent peptidase|nr:VWA-like domain-containing protein [bacterium]